MSATMKKSLVLFLAWNAVIGMLWFWAREGSVVRLQIIVNGLTHTISCNDQLVLSVNVPENEGLASGMPGLGFSKDSRPPLMVKPSEYRQLIVADPNTGEVLVDGRSNLADLEWWIVQGSFLCAPNKRIRSDKKSIGVVGDPSWRNYIIDVTLSNPAENSIYFRFRDDKNYGRAQFRFWRELAVCLIYIKDGKQSFYKLQSIAEPFCEGMKSLVLRFTRIYGVSLAILASFIAVFILSSVVVQAFIRLKTRREP
ncbi:MAG: hypothetical protein WBM27_08195 [bacterium]